MDIMDTHTEIKLRLPTHCRPCCREKMDMVRYHKPVAKRKPVMFVQGKDRHIFFSLTYLPKTLVAYVSFFYF